MRSSEDPTRHDGRADGPAETDAARPAEKAAPRSAERGAPRPGAESPAPDGSSRPAQTAPTSERTPEPVADGGGGGKTAGMWIGLILGAIILVLLLIFVIQNNQTAGFQYFSAEFDLPLGVAMLLAAIAGALVMALVGSVRMIQMSWTIRKLRKQQDKIHRATR